MCFGGHGVLAGWFDDV